MLSALIRFINSNGNVISSLIHQTEFNFLLQLNMEYMCELCTDR